MFGAAEARRYVDQNLLSGVAHHETLRRLVDNRQNLPLDFLGQRLHSS